MKFPVRLLFCFLVTGLMAVVHVCASEADTLGIRSFEAGVYKATSLNYTGIEARDGTLFFANESGVLHYDGSEWNLIPISNFSAATALLETNDKIYVGGRDEFGYLQPDSTGRYTYHSLRHLLNLAEGEKITNIWQIIPLGDDIYFQSIEMILRYDGQHIDAIHLQQAFIFKINEQLYASAISKGLARIDKNSVVMVNTDFKFDNDMAFLHMHGLKGENLLFTADNGIFAIDTLSFKVKQWKSAANEFLSKNSLYFGVVWQDSLYACATYLGGLAILDNKGEIVKTYNKDNGLVQNSLREIIKDRRGNLWLTSDYGLRYLQLPESGNGFGELQPYIRKVTVNETDVPLKELYGSLQTPADYTGSVVFHFATPSYHKEELEYSYFLEPFEHNWSAWKPDVKKEYTNLNGGEYVFHIKARYKESIESSPASLKLAIPVPWFKTRAAYLLGFVLSGLVIVLGVQYRTQRLRSTNKRLGEVIDERTRQLLMQKEQLKMANQELMVKNTELDNFVYRSSHDLIAPLKSLKGLIHISQMEKEADKQADYFRLMHTSVHKLEAFIKSIMDYSSNVKKLIEESKIDLNEILDCIISDIRFYEQASSIKITRNINLSSSFMSDDKRLRIILSNLITNSIKYHNYGQKDLFIAINAFSKGNTVIIEIIDNGKGIEQQYLDKIFEMFFRASNIGAEGSGLGLYIVKDTVHKIGGKVSVTSQVGKGTTFTLVFPTSLHGKN